MPLSFRISPEKEKMIERASKNAGISKSAFIVNAIDEKLGVDKNREQTIREVAGWLSHEEAEDLRESVDLFNRVNAGDWP